MNKSSLFCLCLLSAATLNGMERAPSGILQIRADLRRSPDGFEADPEWGPMRLEAEKELFKARISYQITEKARQEALSRFIQAAYFKRGDLESAEGLYKSCVLAHQRSINNSEKPLS